MKKRSHRLVALALVACLPVSWVNADEAPVARFAPLLADSPFMTLAFKERLAQTETGPTRNLSFTGYAKVDGQWLLCIHNKQSGEFSWIRVDETIGDFLIKSFDVSRETVTLVSNNREIPLALEKP